MSTNEIRLEVSSIHAIVTVALSDENSNKFRADASEEEIAAVMDYFGHKILADVDDKLAEALCSQQSIRRLVESVRSSSEQSASAIMSLASTQGDYIAAEKVRRTGSRESFQLEPVGGLFIF